MAKREEDLHEADLEDEADTELHNDELQREGTVGDTTSDKDKPVAKRGPHQLPIGPARQVTPRRARHEPED